MSMVIEFLDWALQQIHYAEEEMKSLDDHLARFDLIIKGSLDDRAKQEIKEFLEVKHQAAIVALMLCFHGYELKSGQKVDILARLENPYDAVAGYPWLLGILYTLVECSRRLALPLDTPQDWRSLAAYKDRLTAAFKNLTDQIERDAEFKKNIPIWLKEINPS